MAIEETHLRIISENDEIQYYAGLAKTPKGNWAIAINGKNFSLEQACQAACVYIKNNFEISVNKILLLRSKEPLPIGCWQGKCEDDDLDGHKVFDFLEKKKLIDTTIVEN